MPCSSAISATDSKRNSALGSTMESMMSLIVAAGMSPACGGLDFTHPPAIKRDIATAPSAVALSLKAPPPLFTRNLTLSIYTFWPVLTMWQRVQDLIRKGKTLQEIKAAKPTMDYDPRYGKTTGPSTTDMFIEAVYQSLIRKK